MQMRGRYHVHDRKLLECPEHRMPRPLPSAVACPSEHHKSRCNGAALGITCNMHTRELTELERHNLRLVTAHSTDSFEVRIAVATLERGYVVDPKPMRFVRP